MKLVYESLEELNEEFLGFVKNPYIKIITEIHKNPDSLKSFKPWVRAISDIEGNLYIAGSSDILHSDILGYLHKENILSDNVGWIKYDKNKPCEYINCIAWQREANTNDFYLSESYDEYTIDKNINDLLEMKKILEENTLKINFYLQK